MRKFWLTVGWMSLVGSVFDGVLALYALGLAVFVDGVDTGISIELLFREYISWLYWIKALIYEILNKEVVDWIFSLPAIPVYIVRVIVSYYIGRWALGMAAQLAADEVQNQPQAD